MLIQQTNKESKPQIVLHSKKNVMFHLSTSDVAGGCHQHSYQSKRRKHK